MNPRLDKTLGHAEPWKMGVGEPGFSAGGGRALDLQFPGLRTLQLQAVEPQG